MLPPRPLRLTSYQPLFSPKPTEKSVKTTRKRLSSTVRLATDASATSTKRHCSVQVTQTCCEHQIASAQALRELVKAKAETERLEQAIVALEKQHQARLQHMVERWTAKSFEVMLAYNNLKDSGPE